MSEKTNIADSPRSKMNGKPVFSVPAKTVINYKSQFDKKLLCDGITFTAGSACAYSCAFCYVEAMQLKQQAWFKAKGVVGNHMDVVIRNQNAVELARKQIMSKPEAFRRSKKIIYSSPKVDVAANMELVRETAEICFQILELTNWDIRLLSKSNLLPKVAQMLGDYRGATKRLIYGVSTGTLDDKLAKSFEAGTPLVSKRIESLHWLQDNGFRTFGMICPSLPQADYHQFALDMAVAIRADRCEHVWAEVINVRGDSFDRTWEALQRGGFHGEAAAILFVAHNKEAWEHYARATFEAHASITSNMGKLRFLQYITNDTRGWWSARQNIGAVLL
jgi:DNA repair photolyase